MATVTVIGEHQARVGLEFVFNGGQEECRDCRLRGPCLHLKPQGLYRIAALRPVHHDDICRLHEDGVRVVEVEPVPVATTLRAPRAIEGSIVAYEFLPCGNLACGNYALCHPLGLRDGTRVKLAKVGEAVECPVGYHIRRVVCEPAS